MNNPMPAGDLLRICSPSLIRCKDTDYFLACNIAVQNTLQYLCGMSPEQLAESVFAPSERDPRYLNVPGVGSVQFCGGVVYVDDPSPYGYFRKATAEQMEVIMKLFTGD